MDGIGLFITAQNDVTQKDLEVKAHIEQLIKQLGADDWYEREAATRALEEIGLPAEPYLKEALRCPDAEIVLRAKNILQRIEIKSQGKIVFARGNAIWTMDADGKEQTKLVEGIKSGKTLDLLKTMEVLYAPTWSPDGKRILFVGDSEGNDEIYLMDENGRHLKNLTNHPSADGAPCWSADGKQIVFMSNRAGNSEIYRMEADGQNVVRLTNHLAADEFPAWSPDGKLIAFVSMRDGNYEVYVMGPDGSNLKRLSRTPGQNLFSSWSPDSQKIIFVSSQQDEWGIYLTDVTGQNQICLAEPHAMNFNPAWSPDGRKIAFMSNRDGNGEIYEMDANGQNQTRLTQTESFEDFAAWSSNGKWLIFCSTLTGGVWDIYRITVHGPDETEPVAQRLTTEGGWMASWQPVQGEPVPGDSAQPK